MCAHFSVCLFVREARCVLHAVSVARLGRVEGHWTVGVGVYQEGRGGERRVPSSVPVPASHGTRKCK